MKRWTKVFALTLTLAALLLALTGCGEKKNTLGGTYVPGTVIAGDGSEQSYDDYIKEGLERTGLLEGSEEYESLKSLTNITYTFEGDGKMTAAMMGMTVEGTYTLEGEQLTMTVNGQDTVGTYDPEKNTITYQNATTDDPLVLVHQEG